MNLEESADAENAKSNGKTVVTATSSSDNADVNHAIVAEHALSFWQAIRLYPQAVGWSVFFSLGIIMCAFDPQLMGQLYAVPAFQRDFGHRFNVRTRSSSMPKRANHYRMATSFPPPGRLA